MVWLPVLAAQAAPATLPGYQLPDSAVPRKYFLDLAIDPARPYFTGTARVEFDLLAPAKTIWLNAKDLVFQDVHLEADGRAIPVNARTAGAEFLEVDLDTPLGPLRGAELTMHYRGRLDASLLVGPYRRKVEGRWYVYTTFTPIEARRAFPCFDEPRFKTPWEISIRVPQGQKAFSNAHLVEESPGPGRTTVFSFAPTAPLPSELVAFAAGPFDVYDGGTAGQSTPVRVVTPFGHAAQGQPGAEATRQVLPRLEAYTGLTYPFDKLDHLALPDGAYGAVENPGLITYLARRLLVSPADLGENMELRRLQAHEIGHQWFGDLVTQSSWKDVWLSEGFATWISNKMMDEERPAERHNLEAISARERIMEADRFPNRPLRISIENRAQSKDTYNPVVYQKGAGVLLMLEGWLGETKMRDGLRRYLREHAMSTASTEDLAEALTSESGLDVLPVLKSYLDTAGVARIRGSLECSTHPKLKLEQLGTGAVPVCFKAGESSGCAVLKESSLEVVLPTPSCPASVYLNAGGTGYYRTEWSPSQLAALDDQAWTTLTEAEKLTLAFDLRAQKANSAEAKAVLTRLTSDREPSIATAAMEALRAGEK